MSNYRIARLFAALGVMISLVLVFALRAPSTGMTAEAPLIDPAMVGAVTDTSATIQALTCNGACTQPAQRTVRMRYGLAGSGIWTTTANQTTASANYFRARFPISGLLPDTEYEFIIEEPDGSPATVAKRFKTAPEEGTSADFNLAFYSDAKGTNKVPPQGPEMSWHAMHTPVEYNPSIVNVIGDWDHRDPGTGEISGGSPWREMWRDMTTNRTNVGAIFKAHVTNYLDPQIAAYRSYPVVYTWDDHDSCVNNGDHRYCAASYKEMALDAYDEMFPHYPLEVPESIYHSYKWGQAEVFVLDTRFFRDPDVLPEPKTMLGEVQKDWLIAGLNSSEATWKIVISSVPWNPTAGCSTEMCDAWNGFPTEQAEILAATSEVTNVVVVSGDFHSAGQIDDGSAGGVWPEINVPPINMDPDGCGDEFGRDCGTWSDEPAVEPHPHSGLGMMQFDYVEAGPDELTLSAIGHDGTIRASLVLTAIE